MSSIISEQELSRLNTVAFVADRYRRSRENTASPYWKIVYTIRIAMANLGCVGVHMQGSELTKAMRCKAKMIKWSSSAIAGLGWLVGAAITCGGLACYEGYVQCCKSKKVKPIPLKSVNPIMAEPQIE